MKKILNHMKTVRAARSAKTSAAAGSVKTGSVCNYADNYYGDQVCLLAKDGGR